jgi:predicted phosphodiesterase
MKLQVLSDLHTEFAAYDLPDTDADVVILAGDIGVGLAGVKGAMAASKRIGKPVLYVPGNHEFYHNEQVLRDAAYDPAVDGIEELILRMKETAAGSEVAVLNNDEFRHGNTRFLGMTFWTDFELFGAEARDFAMIRASNGINDFTGTIKHRERSFEPRDALEKHLESLRWLTDKLTEKWTGKTVVITHHAPSLNSISSNFRTDPLSACFASDLDAFVAVSSIDLWFHGHTHYCVDYQLGDTRILSNQRCYPYERTQFDDRLVVEV